MSAAAALQIAIDAALTGDSALRTALGATTADPKVFFGEARRGTAPPRVVFLTTDESEGALAQFDAGALSGSDLFHVVTTDRSGLQGKQLYAEVKRVLRPPLALTGYGMVLVTLALAQAFADPDGVHHVVAGRYAWDLVEVPV